MIDIWFQNDINKVLSVHNRVVVTDALGEGRFLLNYLPSDVTVINTGNTEIDEIKARYKAEKDYIGKKVVFYKQNTPDSLCFLLEYAETYGCVVLDDMEAYIRRHLFEEIKENTELGKQELLMAAKLSKGKDLNWWRGVCQGIIKPLDTDALVIDLLNNPKETQKNMDGDVWNIFESEIYSLISKPQTEQPVEVLAQSVADTIFDGLIYNNISDRLLKIYYKCVDSNSMKEPLLDYIEKYKIPQGVSVLNTHPDHCFMALDKLYFKQLSSALENCEYIIGFQHYVHNRTQSKKAEAYKAEWLKDVKVLLDFENDKLYEVNNVSQLATYYQSHFAPLDSAIRHLYAAWLQEEKLLRPYQYRYEQYNKELLDRWFSLIEEYSPTQKNFIADKLSGNGRIAVIVCDGLRLEIAESIANKLKTRGKRNVAFAELPSVTENGMSSLFGCPEVEDIAQTRYNNLKAVIPDIEIIQLERLNSGVTANKLVLMFGDIDQVGEKKQLAGLKDINAYEEFVSTKINELFGMGYSKVYLTADHGFVITGILDEADKIPVPNGDIIKSEERFCLANNAVDNENIIVRNQNYKDSQYQYYAKSDKPFVSKGVYGYAHGGFTPQECIIPAYEFTNESPESLGISIINKAALQNVTGAYFTVKLKAESIESSLFKAERKVMIQIYGNGTLLSTSSVYRMTPSSGDEAEFALPATGNVKVVVIDIQTQQQVDFCDVKKSVSRDLDDLF